MIPEPFIAFATISFSAAYIIINLDLAVTRSYENEILPSYKERPNLPLWLLIPGRTLYVVKYVTILFLYFPFILVFLIISNFKAFSSIYNDGELNLTTEQQNTFIYRRYQKFLNKESSVADKHGCKWYEGNHYYYFARPDDYLALLTFLKDNGWKILTVEHRRYHDELCLEAIKSGKQHRTTFWFSAIPPKENS